MIYIIDNTIRFRDDDGVIWVEGDEESRYDLTATTSRLLAFFLQRQGEILTREFILTHVWDSYGLRSSNSSLNKYISDLRNIFRNLGYTEEVILTLPRVGFAISENIKIETVETQQSNEIKHTATKSKKNGRTHSTIIFFSIAVFAIFIMILFSVFFLDAKKNAPPLQNSYALGQIHGCNVSTLKEIPPGVGSTINTIVKNIIDSKGIKCTDNSIVFLQVSDAVLYGNAGRIFLSHCILNKTSQTISACNNIYQVDYEFKK